MCLGCSSSIGFSVVFSVFSVFSTDFHNPSGQWKTKGLSKFCTFGPIGRRTGDLATAPHVKKISSSVLVCHSVSSLCSVWLWFQLFSAIPVDDERRKNGKNDAGKLKKLLPAIGLFYHEQDEVTYHEQPRGWYVATPPARPAGTVRPELTSSSPQAHLIYFG